MVWWFTSTRHDLSVKSWVRQWLRGNLLDRFLLILIPAAVCWFMAALVLTSTPVFGLFLGFLPFLFLAADSLLDGRRVRGELREYLASDDVILATRCEYVGGHPQLPQGRFAYLLLEGTRENPSLTLGFPGELAKTPDHFQMPVLDLDRLKPESSPSESISASMLAAVDEKAGKLFAGTKVTLTVSYKGVGRTHRVELTSFLDGGDEIRNWRNYLICAQAEADTGVKPYGEWKSLKPGLLVVGVQEGVDEPSRNGHQQPLRRSAFARR